MVTALVCRAGTVRYLGPRTVLALRPVSLLSTGGPPVCGPHTEWGRQLSPTAADICRVTVVTPDRRMELALPTYLPLVDMVPTLVGIVDERLGSAVSGKGVVLQRFGDEPLDQSRTASSLGLRDGDVLHLREADNVLPALRFDDLGDGIAVRLGMLPSRWSSRTTRSTALALSVLAWLAGAALLYSHTPLPTAVAVAGGSAVALLLAGFGAARGWQDGTAALLLAMGAVCMAATAGTLAAPWLRADATLPPAGSQLTMLSALLGGACAAVVGLAAMAFLVEAGSFFLPDRLLVAVILGLVACADGALVTFTSLSNSQATAALSAAAVMFSPLAPTAAFACAGLRLPDLPQSASDIERSNPPIVEATLARRTAAADRYMTCFYAVIAVLGLTASISLAAAHDRSSVWLAALFGLVAIFRAKALTGRWQRLLLIGSGALGVTAALFGLAWLLPAPARVALAAGAAVGASLALVATARVLPDRVIRPYWGRASEILETLLAIAVLPLTLTVVGLLGYIRQLNG
ncbi:MAG: type secretion integral rane protein EccD [Frankiales bacterium]|nr:type secretion integral rane protein EccD [Frankiales bacterium]